MMHSFGEIAAAKKLLQIKTDFLNCSEEVQFDIYLCRLNQNIFDKEKIQKNYLK